MSTPSGADPSTDEALLPKVTSALRSSGQGLDTILPGSTDRFISAIVPAFQNLLAAIERFSDESIRSDAPRLGRYMLTWQLLWEACNSLLAAFTLFQRGYATESLAVSRGALERVAAGIYLFDNPELVPRFKADALPDLGTTAIGPVSRVIRDFGFVYGLLSQVGSHVATANVGSGVLGIEQDHVHLAIGGKLPTVDPELAAWREMVTEFCLIAEQILAAAPEQVFFNSKRVTAARPPRKPKSHGERAGTRREPKG